MRAKKAKGGTNSFEQSRFPIRFASEINGDSAPITNSNFPSKPFADDEEIGDESTSTPVVVFGAAAGGLEAFGEILENLSGNTDFAFVLMQHADSAKRAPFPRRLSKKSQMPVIAGAHGMALQANHVYIVPPEPAMTIVRGTLNLAPRAKNNSSRFSIDYLLRLLAADRSNRAIGVVLSGTSSDGTLGLEAIKAGGGITFAQDELSAKFGNMPRSAIASGCVDFVLPPAKIARELSQLGRHPHMKRGAPSPVQRFTADAGILKLLQARSGVDFTHYRQSTIKRRIIRRMLLLNIDNLHGYARFLKGNPKELDILFREILTNVTLFFHDRDVFQILKKTIFSGILKERSREEPIRLWVPGCSTGEEVYSLAIELLEFMKGKPARVPVQIFATDINENALAKARAGVYLENIAADVPASRLRHYFAKVEHGHQVSKEVRDLCIFTRHDVTNDPPFTKLDLISCRNILPHLVPALQQEIIPLFYNALKPHGYLLAGTDESISQHADLFVSVEKKHRLYQKQTEKIPKIHLAPAAKSRPECRQSPASGLKTGADPNDEIRERNSELAKLNNDLLNLISGTGIPVVLFDINLRIRLFTPSAATLFNLAQADIGGPAEKIQSGIHLSEFNSLLSEVIGTVTLKQMEVRDREGRWHSMSIRPYRTAGHRIDGAVLSLIDVDNIKRELDDLKAARDFSRAVLEAVLEPLIVFDSQLVAKTANHAYYDLFPGPSVAGKPITSLEIGANPVLSELIARVLSAKEEMDNCEITVQAPRLGERTFACLIRSIKSTEGGGALALLKFEDITSRKRAGEELKASEAHHRELFEATFQPTVDGKIIVDADSGEILDANPRASEFTGCRHEQLAGKKFWQASCLRNVISSEAEFFAKKGSICYDEVLIGIEGHDRAVEVSSHVYAAGSRNMLMLNFRDLTQRKNMEEQIRQKQKMDAIARLAGGLAHDFNNLLTVITGYTQMMIDDLEPGSLLAKEAEEILKAANMAAGLTRRLLIFSRRHVVRPQTLNLNATLTGMLERLQAFAGEKCQIETKLCPRNDNVEMDPSQIEQVIYNLIGNSRDAMSAGGRIILETSSVEIGPEQAQAVRYPSGSYVTITVSDNGPGIPPEVMEHLFEPFFSTKDPTKRSGLGLAIVYAVAKQAGGDVEIRSAPGKGTTVTVLLPRATGPEVVAAPQPIIPAPAELQANILLVEDDDSVRAVTRDMLVSQNFEVAEAREAEEALQLFHSLQGKIDLLLTDIVLPGKSGYDLAGELRRLRPDLRVLFISGYAPELISGAPRQIGEAFLQKPFTREQLAETIQNTLRTDALVDERGENEEKDSHHHWSNREDI